MSAGERGPKGDHGQHGDEWVAGDVGEQGERGHTGLTGESGERGAHGDTGQSGDTGATGARGPSNWRSYVAMGVAVAVAFAVFGDQLADKPSKAQTAKIAALAKQNAATIKRVEALAKQNAAIRADTRREAAETHKALCTFRGGLRDQVKDGAKFLTRHPEGAFGFKPQEIRESLARQQHAIADLRALRCQ